jgi:SAM-dependent methyltransferase
MHPCRRETVLALLFAPLLPLPALARNDAETKPYEPTVGQPGKDVVWVPTPDALVQRMLDMAEVKPNDFVVDLGSGDGKIAIAAAKRGARARGIEYNPDMVALSRRRAREENVKVDFVHGDIFKTDFSRADVVTMYLLPSLNEKLRPTLLRMKPGTRVTTHQFLIGDWEPDRTETVESRSAHLWIVPARVAGNWSVQAEGQPPLRLRLQQKYQKLDGHAIRDGRRLPLQDAGLRGTQVRFALADDTAGPLRFEGTASAPGRISGSMTGADGQARRFTAVRA